MIKKHHKNLMLKVLSAILMYWLSQIWFIMNKLFLV